MIEFEYKGNKYNYIPYDNKFNYEELPKAERYNKSEWINLHCAFDIETTRIRKDFSTMYVWQFAINEITIIGRTWEEFRTFLDDLSNYYNLVDEKIKLRVWVHNLSHEWSFMRKWLKYKYDSKRKKMCVFAKEERRIVYFTTHNNIEFRDSLILTQRPLSAFKDFYKLKIGKLSGEIDYSIIRHSGTKLDNDILAYCINDVQTLAEWDKVYITRQFLRDSKKIPLTSTGIVREKLKHNFKSQDKQTRDKLKRKLYRSFPTENNYKLWMEWLYRGGYVHSNAWFAGDTHINKNMGSYDKKSSYPASAMQNLFPWEFIKRSSWYFYENVWNRENENVYNYEKWKKMAFIAVLRFSNIRSKTTHHIESKSKLWGCENGKYDNGRLISANKITVILNEIDFLNYMDFYEWDSIECTSFLIADKEPLPDYLLKMFFEYFYKKESLPKESLDYNLSKFELNGLYGMCVSGLFHQSLTINENNDIVIDDYEQDFEKLKYKQILLPQWGIWISAYSRREELLIHKCDSVMYGDTDSGKMQNIFYNDGWIQAHNDKLKRINRKLNTFGYPVEVYRNLGCFEFEEKYYKFKCLGAKRYCGTYIKKDKATGKYKLHTKVTASGIPLGAVEKYAKIIGKDVYDIFNETLVIPSEYTGKLTSNYNDNEDYEAVTDYNGVTMLCYEKSNITLNDSKFDMKIKEDYLELIEFYVNLKGNDRRYGRNYL